MLGWSSIVTSRFKVWYLRVLNAVFDPRYFTCSPFYSVGSDNPGLYELDSLRNDLPTPTPNLCNQQTTSLYVFRTLRVPLCRHVSTEDMFPLVWYSFFLETPTLPVSLGTSFFCLKGSLNPERRLGRVEDGRHGGEVRPRPH